MKNSGGARQQKPQKRFEQALYDFLCMAKGQSQSLLIRYFLEQVIKHSDVCEQGSVLLYCPLSTNTPMEVGSLKLYDRETNANSLLKFPGRDFSVNEGLAGLVFRKRAPEFVPAATAHPEFIPTEDQDIGSIYCLPIFVRP
jgi:hypothetical protein